jgi:hypothetical protein
MVEFINGTLYSCACGYKTLYKDYASKHTKTKKCVNNVMTKRDVEFVLKEDHLASHGNTDIINKYQGDNINGDKISVVDNSVDNSTTNNVNITLVLPERTTKEDFVEYLESMERLGFRTPEQVAAMPGKLLMFTRGAKELPGAIIERNKKIIEKLPDGTERIMGKKKAVRTYTHEAVDALCLRPPTNSASDFLEMDRGTKRTKMSIQDAVKLRATDSVAFHHEVPTNVKTIQQRIESHTEKALDKITLENKTNGFL